MLRSRPDKALEVFVEDKFVGWLAGPYCDFNCKNGHLVIPSVDLPAGPSSFDEEKWTLRTTYALKLGRRSFTLDRHDLESYRGHCEEILAQQVPLYAERERLAHIDATRFHWRVIEASQDDHEFLFDLPYFEPLDTGVDHDSYITKREPYFGPYALRPEMLVKITS